MDTHRVADALRLLPVVHEDLQEDGRAAETSLLQPVSEAVVEVAPRVGVRVTAIRAADAYGSADVAEAGVLFAPAVSTPAWLRTGAPEVRLRVASPDPHDVDVADVIDACRALAIRFIGAECRRTGPRGVLAVLGFLDLLDNDVDSAPSGCRC